MAKLERFVLVSLWPSGFTPGKVCRSTWMCTVTATGQATRSGNARPLELQRSSVVIQSTRRRRRNRWSQTEFYVGNRLWTASGQFLTEVGCELIPRVWSDSSACRGIVRKAGTGRLGHLEIRHIWTQERLQKVSENAIATESECSARRRADGSNPDELRIALRRRGWWQGG